MDKNRFSANKKDLLFWLSRCLNYPLASPDVIQIPLTNRCNLRCKMCTIAAEDNKSIGRDEIFRIIDQASDMGIKEAVLTGGEPFLRNDLFEIFDYCKKNNIRSILTTNGTLIGAELANKIINSGLSHLHFSLDGLKEANDYLRGKGSFDRTVNGIKAIEELRKKRNSRLSIGIACIVMDHNVEELPKLLEFADSLNVDVINFQPLLKDNANTPNRQVTEFWIKEERMSFLDQSIEIIRKFRSKHISVYEEPGLRLISKYYRKNTLIRDWKCFGGHKTIFICIGEGNAPLVYSCHGICGNLREKSLKDCWISSEAKRLRKSAKQCKIPCLQSCYSRVASESLLLILKGFYNSFFA